MNRQRADELRQSIRKNKIDAFLVSNPVNLRYILNFGQKGCVALISNRKKIRFFCSPIYYQQACCQLKLDDIEILDKEKFSKVIYSEKIKKIGFESDAVSFLEFQKLKKQLKNIKLIPQKNLIEDLRMIKDSKEINLIRKAAKIAGEAYNHIKSNVHIGLNEVEVADKIYNFMRLKGTQGASFDFVVAGGPNSAFPHHIPSSRKFINNDMIVLDLGCIYKGYCSDITRTICFEENKKNKQYPYKKLSKQLKINYSTVYKIVFNAQKEAIKLIKPGIKCADVDQAARMVIKKAGLENFFIHSTGHGVGLEVHEMPYLSKDSKDILRENMIVTVEPGIYIAGWGGVRIEDMILVTKKGYDILTKSGK